MTTSGIYRTFTLAYVFGVLFTMTSSLSLLSTFAARPGLQTILVLLNLVSGLIIPFYLLARNISTYRNGEQMLPYIPPEQRPWYYGFLIAALWFLGIIALLSAVSTVIALVSVPLAGITTGMVFAFAVSFSLPVIFLLEILARENANRQATNSIPSFS